MVTYVFPGQGSQSKGMGGALFDEFKEITAQADQILEYPIRELCINDPNSTLGLTQYTQPAVYVVNALNYLKKIKETREKPDFLAGHSLGEYSALFAAGVFDFATGLRMVKKRGELISQAAGGIMAAVIGLDEEQIVDVLKQNHLDSIDIANLNSPFQIVISGPKEDIERGRQIFEKIKDVKMVSILKTSGAFHSRYMETARRDFETYINSFEFSEPIIPVISNLQARPYRCSDIKRNLIEQMTHPVKWTESIRYLMGLGEMEFEEIGNGRILTGLIGRIQKETGPLVVSNAEIIDNCPAIQSEIPDKQDSALREKSLTTVIKNVRGKAKDFILSTEETLSKNAKPIKGKAGHRNTQQISKACTGISPGRLGSSDFKKEYNLKYAYLAGGMYRGIASKEMVVKMGKAEMMGFFGTGGLEISEIEKAIKHIQGELNHGEAYGLNLPYDPGHPDQEMKLVELMLHYGVRHLEAAAYINVSPALVLYRLKGLKADEQKSVIEIPHKLMAKVSRPEVAETFMSPPAERITAKLLNDGQITQDEYELSRRIPMIDDLCVEADSGGHTDQGVAYALMPAMLKLRDGIMRKYDYSKRIRVGAAGGIGTPEAAAAAFILGADFILTGSINQCTVEAGTHGTVKDLLQQINIQDTDYAPAGDMFELGAKVQVLRRGVFFPVRANKLFELYRRYSSLDEIDAKTRIQLEEKYFHRSFEQVYEDVKAFYPRNEIEKAENNPKHKMALVFKWYFGYSSRLALTGDDQNQVDYQIPCGPALGAFNQWVKGTALEDWRNRHVDEIGLMIMNEAANLLERRYDAIVNE
jgi:trans-AT polyketide synthase/acyltransferase/oxidoreductase domain-containing protein